MGAIKNIPKDWRKLDKEKSVRSVAKRTAVLSRLEVTRSEDLPELMTTKEAGVFLRRHYKTIEEYRNDGSLRFIKVKNRYFTTPEFIAEFLEIESRK